MTTARTSRRTPGLLIGIVCAAPALATCYISSTTNCCVSPNFGRMCNGSSCPDLILYTVPGPSYAQGTTSDSSSLKTVNVSNCCEIIRRDCVNNQCVDISNGAEPRTFNIPGSQNCFGDGGGEEG